MWLYTICNINVFILHINYILYVHYLYILVSHLVVWQPTHGTRRHGRPYDSYINNLEREPVYEKLINKKNPEISK